MNQPFFADGNVAIADCCLAPQYLATWILLRGASKPDAEEALCYVAPVGEQADFIARAFKAVEPFVATPSVHDLLAQT